MRVESRDGIRISNGTVTSFATGILLDTTSNSEVIQVNALENFYGMYLEEATDNRLSKNIIGPNTYGIHLQRSSRNLVTRNDSSGNRYNSPDGYGLNLISSHDNEITENVMAGNVIQGIWLIASTGNMIYRNDFVDNRPNGARQSTVRAWATSSTLAVPSSLRSPTPTPGTTRKLARVTSGQTMKERTPRATE